MHGGVQVHKASSKLRLSLGCCGHTSDKTENMQTYNYIRLKAYECWQTSGGAGLDMASAGTTLSEAHRSVV